MLRQTAVLLFCQLLITSAVAETAQEKLDAARNLLAKAEEAVARHQRQTNCRLSVSGARNKALRLGSNATIQLYLFPQGDASVLPVELPRGAVLRETPTKPENGFVCVKIEQKNISGWVRVDQLEHIKSSIPSAQIDFDDPFAEIIECSSGTPKSKPIFQNLEVYGQQIKGFKGCDAQPENSYAISLELQGEVEAQLNTMMIASQSTRCSQLFIEITQSLGAYLDKLRSNHPQCGARSDKLLPYRVKNEDVNVRKTWIEGASADVEPVGKLAGDRIWLLDRVGNWGYFKLSPKGGHGWIRMRLVEPSK